MTADIYVVTGANSGIGKETARSIAATGATTVLACRHAGRAEAAAAQLRDATGNRDVTTIHIDLAALDSVEHAVAGLIDRFGRVDVLVNNAGGIWSTRQLTTDGFEHTFQVNYLAPYLLTRRLLAAGLGARPRRIVNVTSVGNRLMPRLRWDDLQFERRYIALAAYYQSKLALISFTGELARRFGPAGVTAHSCHPGLVRTRLGKDGDVTGASAPFVAATIAFGITAARGADTPAFLATAPEAERSNGGYWVRRKEHIPSGAARDPNTAQRLWELSERQLAKAGHPA